MQHAAPLRQSGLVLNAGCYVRLILADTIIAIKAPSGTTLEVPDPDEGMEYPQRRYQIYLKSISGPVEVFLVSPVEGGDNAMSGVVSDVNFVREVGVALPNVLNDSAAVESSVPVIASKEGESRRKRGRPSVAPHGSPSQFSTSGADADVSPLRCGDGALKLVPVHASDDFWAEQAMDCQPMVGINDLFSDPNTGI